VTLTCTDAHGHATVRQFPVVSAHDIATPPTGTLAPLGGAIAFSAGSGDVPGGTHQTTGLRRQRGRRQRHGPAGLTAGTPPRCARSAPRALYHVRMNVTDGQNVTSFVTTRGDLPELVVIYDPTDGYAAGGGSYPSPPGAPPSNPSAAGKVAFGFAFDFIGNVHSAHSPHGTFRLSFPQGGLEFNAVSIDDVSLRSARRRRGARARSRAIPGRSPTGS
jgi:hypothetical protein